jgi:hypothetical protein
MIELQGLDQVSGKSPLPPAGAGEVEQLSTLSVGARRKGSQPCGEIVRAINRRQMRAFSLKL